MPDSTIRQSRRVYKWRQRVARAERDAQLAGLTTLHLARVAHRVIQLAHTGEAMLRSAVMLGMGQRHIEGIYDGLRLASRITKALAKQTGCRVYSASRLEDAMIRDSEHSAQFDQLVASMKDEDG